MEGANARVECSGASLDALSLVIALHVEGLRDAYVVVPQTIARQATVVRDLIRQSLRRFERRLAKEGGVEDTLLEAAAANKDGLLRVLLGAEFEREAVVAALALLLAHLGEVGGVGVDDINHGAVAHFVRCSQSPSRFLSFVAYIVDDHISEGALLQVALLILLNLGETLVVRPARRAEPTAERRPLFRVWVAAYATCLSGAWLRGRLLRQRRLRSLPPSLLRHLLGACLLQLGRAVVFDLLQTSFRCCERRRK